MKRRGLLNWHHAPTDGMSTKNAFIDCLYFYVASSSPIITEVTLTLSTRPSPTRRGIWKGQHLPTLKQQTTSKVFSVQTMPAAFAAKSTLVCPDRQIHRQVCWQRHRISGVVGKERNIGYVGFLGNDEPKWCRKYRKWLCCEIFVTKCSVKASLAVWLNLLPYIFQGGLQPGSRSRRAAPDCQQ